jgi:urea carboxylase
VPYEHTLVRRTGDLSLTVEFGDDISLAVSIRVLALAQILAEYPIDGVIETIPAHRSIGIVVDPLRLSPSKLEQGITEALSESSRISALRSRIVHIPLLYDDPWSEHCAEIHGAPNGVQTIAEASGIAAEDVPRQHSATLHWVGALGFTPGCTQAFPMDKTCSLLGPKYAVPRKWTYPRIVGLGGRLTSPYTVKCPGGYQMLGRTPLDWYDSSRKNPSYGGDIVLSRVGDRQKFEPIDLETYDMLREEVVLGSYEYRIEEASFDISAYTDAIERAT